MRESHDFLSYADFNLFIDTIPKLLPFNSLTGRPPDTPEAFQLLFKLMFYCGLRIKEALQLVKSDFDLKNKELRIESKKAKSNKTTITPNLIAELDTYLGKLSDNKKLFKISRMTAWQYSKTAGRVALLGLFKAQKERQIKGVFTLLFRNSCERHMLNNGASKDLVDLKLRLRSESAYGGLTLDELKKWETRSYGAAYLSEDEIEKHVEWYSKKREIYEKLAESVEEIIKKIIPSEVKFIAIHRTKEVSSFKEKIRSGIKFHPQNMQDLAGIRVIASSKIDVETICSILKEAFEIDKSRSRDKAEILDESEMGYLAIHYVARLAKARLALPENKLFDGLYFEIQVRTILQDAWAEIARNRLYKRAGDLPREIPRRFYLVAALLESADNELKRLEEIDEEFVREYGKQDDIFDKIERGNLNISIDATSLEQYIQNTFDFPNLQRSFGTFPERIIRELNMMGIEKLSELDKIIPEKLNEVYVKNNTPKNYYGIITDVLIISNPRNFLRKVFSGDDWELENLSSNSHKVLSEFDIDINQLIKRYRKKP